MKHKELIDQMTLEEKASLCSGADMWHFQGIERLGIPSIMVTDGPHGVRKMGKSQNIAKSTPTTCFPPACATACSWDTELVKLMGKSIGEEAKSEGVSIVLGPGVNIKRSPLCGRNFEYFSEDPILAGELSAAFIQGVESQGVGTSLKHFAVNNQETFRMTINANVDERTLREIYLTPFEIAVKKGNPATLMCSYNSVNGNFASENPHLLTEILRDEWGYKGIVMSDWGATNFRPDGVKAGLDIEMPSSGGINDKKVVQAVKDGILSEEILDRNVDRILDVIFKYAIKENSQPYNKIEHNDISRIIATKSAVLLKNDGTLPLNKSEKILVVGELAEKPRFQGAGSSFINCTKITSLIDALNEGGYSYDYEKGYTVKKCGKVDKKLIRKAVAKASEYDIIIVSAGLTNDYEAEGFDRTNVDLPVGQNALIEELIKLNKKVVVILSTGSPVALPWSERVNSTLLMYLGGQASGGACCDLLYGNVNPSGKLAETFPLSLQDNPANKYFPGKRYNVDYLEGMYVGYRYYNQLDCPVQYEFGHGLSYTTFAYSNLEISSKEYNVSDTLEVSIDIKNTGSVFGEEIVQLYVDELNAPHYTTAPALKAFSKVSLSPNETKTVKFVLDKRSFAFYNTDAKDWQVSSGEFNILIGASSRKINQNVTIKVIGDAKNEIKTPQSWYTAPKNHDIPVEEFEYLLGHTLPQERANVTKGNFTENECLLDMSHTSWQARAIMKIASFSVRASMGFVPKTDPNYLMMYEIFKTSPIKSLSYSSQGVFSARMVEGFIDITNGHFFKGLKKLIFKSKNKESD